MTVITLCLATALAVVGVVRAPDAFACARYNPVTGQCIQDTSTGGNNKPPPRDDDGGSTGGGSTGGGKPGGGGGGYDTGDSSWTPYSDVDYYWNPKSGVPRSLGAGPSFVQGYAVAYYTGSNNCGAKTTPWGAYVGVKTTQAGKQDQEALQNGNPRFKKQTTSRYTCLEPPRYKDTTSNCAAYATSTAKGPYRNPTVAATTFFNSGQINSPFVKGGKKKPSLCTTGMSLTFAAGSPHYGQYQMDSKIYSIACTIRTYTTKHARTGKIPPTEVRGCSAPFLRQAVTGKWQQFCQAPGYALNWSGSRSYTADECASSTSGLWTCGPQINQWPTWAGLAANRPVSVIDDGKNRLARWNSPSLTGITGVRNKLVRLDYRSGTPFRAGKGANADTQPFVTAPAADQWANGWAGVSKANGKSDWNVNFQAAGMPGQPWTSVPQWKFTGDFLVKQVTVTGVTMPGGKLTTKVTNKRATMTATCTGKPLQVNATRARITN
jgi:hypothetical protein